MFSSFKLFVTLLKTLGRWFTYGFSVYNRKYFIKAFRNEISRLRNANLISVKYEKENLAWYWAVYMSKMSTER